MRKFLQKVLAAACLLAPLSAGATHFSTERVGDILSIALPAYALGRAASEDGWSGTIQFAELSLATMISSSEIQKLTKAPRPNGHPNGFPSGHAASAFSGAMFIHKRYGWRQAAIPYVGAAVVGFSRIQSKWHYFYQVAGGAAIAGLWTWLLVEDGRDSPPPVMLSADPSGARLDFAIRF